MPRDPKYVRPPAAEIESVHPSYGSAVEEAMIEGLTITTLTCYLFFLMYFSARFLLKV